MKLTFWHILATIILVMSFGAPMSAGPLEDAAAAYVKQDYATALRLFRPLGEHGNAQMFTVMWRKLSQKSRHARLIYDL